MNILLVSPHAEHLKPLHQYIQGNPHYNLYAHTTFEAAFFEISRQTKFFDMVILDPQSIEHLKDHSKSIRRLSDGYIYIAAFFPMDSDASLLECGVNFGLSHNNLESQIPGLFESCHHLYNLMKVIGNADYDSASSGGVIARSAFNELFLGALDRAGRHMEDSYLLDISIDNYKALFDLGGPYIADYAIAKLSIVLVNIRRQSDIISQIANDQFALLLQPGAATLPLQAAERFAESLENASEIVQDKAIGITLSIRLTSLPSGQILFTRQVEP